MHKQDMPNVSYIFDRFGIGKVSRVDFVPIGKKPGFRETELKDDIVSAFVHFHEFYNYPLTHLFCNELENERSYNLYLNQIYESHSYWICLKSKKPIANTVMNNAQIVDNCLFLENKIDSMMELIQRQEERINQLEMALEMAAMEPNDMEFRVEELEPLVNVIEEDDVIEEELVMNRQYEN
jgi:hypothetical protein